MNYRRSGLVLLSTIFAFLTLAALAARPAAAQYGPPPPGYGPRGGGYYAPPPPPPGPHLMGLTLGGSIGGGSFHLSEDNGKDYGRFEGLSLEGHIGGMVTPRLGVLFDGWLVAAAIDDYTTFQHSIGTLALRYFVAQIVWLQGGLGFGQLAVTDDYNGTASLSELGGAVMLGVGVELLQTPTFGLDLSLRLGAAGYDGASVNMSSLQIGVSWY
jgi:hypothetical protein